MQKRLPLITAFLAVLVSPCQSVSALPEEEEIVKVEFQVLSIDGTIRDLSYLTGDGTLSPLVAFDGSRSFTYEYEGPPFLRIYPDDAVAGTPPKAVVDLKDVAKKSLLLIFPQDDGEISVVLIPDGEDVHPLGSYRFFNLTGSPVAVVANDSRHMLKPMSDYLVEVFPENSDESTCRIRVAIEEEGTWKMLYANTWIGSSDSRFLAIIKNEDDGKVIIRRIRDTI
ncbi:MAG: hypothetical protein AAGJ81_01335 [Verrucomicrobiota bacterium]